MKKFISIIVLFSFICYSQISPCSDSLFVHLQIIPLDSMSQNEAEYLVSIKGKCIEYQQAEYKAHQQQQSQQREDIENEQKAQEIKSKAAAGVFVAVIVAIAIPIIIIVVAKKRAERQVAEITNGMY